MKYWYFNNLNNVQILLQQDSFSWIKEGDTGTLEDQLTYICHWKQKFDVQVDKLQVKKTNIYLYHFHNIYLLHRIIDSFPRISK